LATAAQARVICLLDRLLADQTAGLLLDEAVDGQIRLPQRALAAMLGVTGPSLNKALKVLERHRWITLDYAALDIIYAAAPTWAAGRRAITPAPRWRQGPLRVSPATDGSAGITLTILCVSVGGNPVRQCRRPFRGPVAEVLIRLARRALLRRPRP